MHISNSDICIYGLIGSCVQASSPYLMCLQSIRTSGMVTPFRNTTVLYAHATVNLTYRSAISNLFTLLARYHTLSSSLCILCFHTLTHAHIHASLTYLIYLALTLPDIHLPIYLPLALYTRCFHICIHLPGIHLPNVPAAHLIYQMYSYLHALTLFIIVLLIYLAVMFYHDTSITKLKGLDWHSRHLLNSPGAQFYVSNTLLFTGRLIPGIHFT